MLNQRHGLPIAVDRLTGIEADVRFTGDKRIVCEALVECGVFDDKHVIHLYRVTTERNGTRCFLYTESAA